jgi:hypothetical protein
MQRNWIIAASGVWLVVSLMAGTLVSAALSRGPLAAQPRTYQAAVIAVLNRHTIPYRDVQVHDECQPSPSDCFALNVIVIMETHPLAGQIVCRLYHEDCALSVPGLSLRRIPLPPLKQDPPWLVAIRHWIWQARRTALCCAQVFVQLTSCWHTDNVIAFPSGL